MAKKKISKEEEEQLVLRDAFRKSTILTTEELAALRKNALDNVIGRYYDKLKNIQKVTPEIAEKIIDKYRKRHTNYNFNSIQDIIKYITDYFIYYDVIKTQEELEREFERARKFVLFEGMDLPIVVEFDYQYFTDDAIFQKPTFYSYYNPKTVTSYGKGAYHIAFPSTQAYLTDEEVMVAMKHEFGHIFQGHCTIKPKDNFEVKTNNQAMDISINLGMTAYEQELLFSVARKIWNNPEACPCMSLAKPEGEGGFGIGVSVSPGDWRGTSGFIRAYYKKKNKGEGEGEGGEGEGEGGGQGGSTGGGTGQGGGGTGGDQKPPEIKAGSIIWIPGKNVYGQVTVINKDTGELVYDEFTPEEWENVKENQRRSSGIEYEE